MRSATEKPWMSSWSRHTITTVSYEEKSCAPLEKALMKLYWTFEISYFFRAQEVRHFTAVDHKVLALIS